MSDKVDGYSCPGQLYPYWFSTYLIYQLLKKKQYWIFSTEFFNNNSGYVSYSFQLYQFLPHVFWLLFVLGSVRCIHFKDCYFFLRNWLLYHYVISLFIHDNFPLFWNPQICIFFNLMFQHYHLGLWSIILQNTILIQK